MIHRDLKPQNIVVGEFGETIVLDWGLARRLGAGPVPAEIEEDQETECFASVADGPVGTLAYMSPEQARGKTSIRSDIFSLGSILYSILTGRSPYLPEDGEDERALRVRIDEARYSLPRKLRPKASRALEAVCLKAMARDPMTRYSAASELGHEVARFLADEPVSAWPEPFHRRARRWARQNRTTVTAAVAAALVALVGTAAVLAVVTWSNHELTMSNNALAAEHKRVTKANENLQAANAQLEQARDIAEAHFAPALRAVEHYHRSVSENLDVKNRPELGPLRQELLQAPLEFYGQLKKDLQDNGEGRPETSAKYAEAVVGFAQITALIGSEPDAIAAYQHAIEVLD